jgi:hypothetical protein
MAASNLILIAATAMMALPAFAGEKSSAYTKLDLAACRQEAPNPDDPLEGGVWWCEGYQGIPVRAAEGDLRFLISYGDNAANEPAASQTLPNFNHVGSTIEWRLDDGRPFATILRWFTDPGDGGPKGQYLVITALGGPGRVCQIGTVNALVNKDANDVAREVADNAAPDFDCTNDRVLEYGLTGDDAQE